MRLSRQRFGPGPGEWRGAFSTWPFLVWVIWVDIAPRPGNNDQRLWETCNIITAPPCGVSLIAEKTNPMSASAPKPAPPLWLLVLITFCGTLAMHIFVPALPDAAQDLQASKAAMQMTVSLYIVGLAVGQLIYGPCSDRFGRRPTLMVGLTLYTVAGLAAALSPGVHALIAARLVQALGGCAGLVLGRAMVRDTAAPDEAVRRLALMNLVVTVGPGLAPLVGSALSAAVGWRAIFVLLGALGLANILFAWRLLPETGRPAETGRALSLARDYTSLLGSPAFLGYAIGGGCATTAMYAFIAAAPFIFTDVLHQPPHRVGLYLSCLIAGVSLGSALTSRLVGSVAMERLMVGANALSVFGALAFLVAVVFGRETVGSTIGLMFLFTLGAGMASPAALTKAVSVNPTVIGSAAGLYGCVQMAVGALCTSLAGFGQNPALAAAITLAGAGVVGQFAFWIALRAETSRRD